MVVLRTSVLPVGVVALVALAGCSQAPSSPQKTVTVTESATPTASGSATPSGTDTGFANGTGTSTATPSSSPSVVATLGGVCDDLLPLDAVAATVGQPLPGKTAFIVGQAEPSIERLVYLNCQYGIAAPAKGKPAVAKIEIGISLYASDIRAQARVSGTVSDFVSLGAKATATSVEGKPATILTGYHNPTLVMAVGPRTVAVTLLDKYFGASQTTVFGAVAKAAVDATANFQK